MYQCLKYFNLTRKTAQKGFTLIELFVTMGIFAILVGLATVSLGNIERTSSIGAEVNKLVTDIKEQQIKAMAGDVEVSGGTANVDYGVHLESGSYTLFRGTYTAGNSSNFEVELPSAIQITAGSDLVFTKGSGELAAATSITLTDTASGQTRTISINKYGVVTGIN